MEFTARGCVPGKVRLTFSARNETGWMEIAGVQLVEIPPGFLPPDATLEKGRLPLPVANDNARVRRDFFEFLAGVELAYARGDARVHQGRGRRQFHGRLLPGPLRRHAGRAARGVGERRGGHPRVLAPPTPAGPGT